MLVKVANVATECEVATERECTVACSVDNKWLHSSYGILDHNTIQELNDATSL
jgi:hypothetical protein